MSTPTQPMPGTDVRAEIARFVTAVDRALDDLPRDDAAELTDGLEADLTEACAAEGVSPTERFGSPETYAAELRSAAGLPPRNAGKQRGPGLGQTLALRRAELERRLHAQPWWPQAVEYGHELRPAWWALRGATLVGLVVIGIGVLLGGAGVPLMVIVFVPAAIWGAVVSMRYGAADSDSAGRTGRVLTLANLAAVVTLLLTVLALVSGQSSDDIYYGEPVSSNGLTSNGQAVTNVFAYDAEGNPLTRVRLYDQSGRPLSVGDADREGWDDATGESWRSLPDSGSGPREWNLYPLLRVTPPAPSDGQENPDATGPTETQGEIQGPVAPPYAQLPALPTPSANPSTTPSATPSASPSASPSSSGDSKG